MEQQFFFMFWAGEMAQWLRALAALLEDLGSIPSTHITAYTACDSTSREPNPHFWPLLASGTHVVHKYTCRQDIHTHKIK